MQSRHFRADFACASLGKVQSWCVGSSLNQTVCVCVGGEALTALYCAKRGGEVLGQGTLTVTPS